MLDVKTGCSVGAIGGCMYVVSRIDLSQNVHVSRSLIYVLFRNRLFNTVCLCDLCNRITL